MSLPSRWRVCFVGWWVEWTWNFSISLSVDPAGWCERSDSSFPTVLMIKFLYLYNVGGKYHV